MYATAIHIENVDITFGVTVLVVKDGRPSHSLEFNLLNYHASSVMLEMY